MTITPEIVCANANGQEIDTSTYHGEPGFNRYNTESQQVTLLGEHEFNENLMLEGTALWRSGEADYHQAWAAFTGAGQSRYLNGIFETQPALAGLAGGLLMANQSLSPELGGIFLLQAFGVVIVGGMGSIRGAFIAAILLGMIESFGTYFFPQYPGIYFLIALAVILLVKPEGIMGKEQTA